MWSNERIENWDLPVTLRKCSLSRFTHGTEPQIWLVWVWQSEIHLPPIQSIDEGNEDLTGRLIVTKLCLVISWRLQQVVPRLLVRSLSGENSYFRKDYGLGVIPFTGDVGYPTLPASNKRINAGANRNVEWIVGIN